MIKKGKRLILFDAYLRLRNMSAAATATIMTTAAPIAMYVVVGTPLSGCGATLGDGEPDCTGVEVGAVV